METEIASIVRQSQGVSTHSELDINRASSVGVYVCGPRKFANNAWASANQYNVGKIRVDVDVMVF